MAACSLKPPLPILSDPKLIITGPTKLSGHVTISGSKNASLPILAATLCSSGASKLLSVPYLSDTRTMASILGSLGAQVECFGNEMVVDSGGFGSVLEPCADAVGRIGGGFFVLGQLLARSGEAVVALPGGCDIGARPVDLHVRGLRALGPLLS